MSALLAYLAASVQLVCSVRLGDDDVADQFLHEDSFGNLSSDQVRDDDDASNIHASGPGECTEIQIDRDTTMYYPTRGIYIAVGTLNGRPRYRSQDNKYMLWFDARGDENGGPGWCAGERQEAEFQPGRNEEFLGSHGYTIKCYGDYTAAHIDEYDWDNDCKGVGFSGPLKHEQKIEFRCLQRNPTNAIKPCEEFKSKMGCEHPQEVSNLMKRVGKKDTPEPRCWWGFKDENDEEEGCHRRECEEIVVHRNDFAQQVKTGTYKRAKHQGKPVDYDGRPLYVGAVFSVFFSDGNCFESEKDGTCRGWHVGMHYTVGKHESESTGIACYDMSRSQWMPTL
eukprot:TRINITY_DN101324_c0_g1_i1.p1 TRINITY_DN101324_c0_g1~~TRINITY_DN101324_c0_g1_i1.p1  ORF type:complete len:338 (+),score=46.28 TRINITY_DN101324_c0_g1_i1:94-1107(+)